MEFENKFSNIPVDVGDKFRTTPIDGEALFDVEDIDMEVLHAKLDAISERTDSEDVSSVNEASVKRTISGASSIKPLSKAQKVTATVASNTEEIQVNVVVTTNTSCNTESVVSQMKQTQTLPTTTQVSATQCPYETDGKSAQTERTISLIPENTNSVHINPRRETKLQVQLLTPINIGNTLVSQTTLHYSIDGAGRTNIFHQNLVGNAAFIEISSPRMTEKKMKVDIRITDEYKPRKQYPEKPKTVDGEGLVAKTDIGVLAENSAKSITIDKEKKRFDKCICKQGQVNHIPEKNDNMEDFRINVHNEPEDSSALQRTKQNSKASKEIKSEPTFQFSDSTKPQRKAIVDDIASPKAGKSENIKQVLTQVSKKLQSIKYQVQKGEDQKTLEETEYSFNEKDESDQIFIGPITKWRQPDQIQKKSKETSAESDKSKSIQPSPPNEANDSTFSIPISIVKSKGFAMAPETINILSKPVESDATATLPESSAEKNSPPLLYLYRVSETSKSHATSEESRTTKRIEEKIRRISKEVAKHSHKLVKQKHISVPKSTTTNFDRETEASSSKEPNGRNAVETCCSVSATQSLGNIDDLMTFSTDEMELPTGEIYYRDVAKYAVSPVSSYTSKILGKSDSKKFKNSTTGSDTSDKEKILKSYHIYDNVNEHDPGVLTTSSFDLIGIIDEDVYKTYINPRGYLPPPKYDLNVVSSNILEPAKKIYTLEKIASSKFLPSLRSSSEKDTGRPVTPTTLKEDTQNEKEQTKLWDLGLYASKATQYSFQEETSVEKMKALDPNQSYETLSFTLSYSTEETISPDTSLNVISHKSSGEYKSEISKTQRSSRSANYMKSLPHLADEQHTVLKSLKEKLSKNLPSNNDSEDGMEDVGSLVREDQSLSEFIVGLTGSEKIKRVSKQIRKSFQKSESKYRHRDDFDVLPVHVHGDCIPENFHNQFYTPLDQAENGRYKDEENLFHETQLVREKRKNLEYFMKPRHKNIYTKYNNSDSLTTEHTFSEGEVKCQCCVSLGRYTVAGIRKN